MVQANATMADDATHATHGLVQLAQRLLDTTSQAGSGREQAVQASPASHPVAPGHMSPASRQPTPGQRLGFTPPG